MSFICVLGVSILNITTIFLLYFGAVPKVWYFAFSVVTAFVMTRSLCGEYKQFKTDNGKSDSLATFASPKTLYMH